MRPRRVFLIVWLPLFIIIFGAGMYYLSTQNVDSNFFAQGIVIYGLYGAGVAAIIAAVVTGLYRVVSGRRKPEPPKIASPA